MAKQCLTVEALALELGVTRQRVYQLLRKGRIAGARKHGRDWLIPSPVVRLDPPRRKKGAGDD